MSMKLKRTVTAEMRKFELVIPYSSWSVCLREFLTASIVISRVERSQRKLMGNMIDLFIFFIT